MTRPPSPSTLSSHARVQRHFGLLALCGIAGLFSLVGCQQRNDIQSASDQPMAQQGVAPKMKAAASPEPVPQPRDGARAVAQSVISPDIPDAAPGGKIASLAGGWVNAGGACDSGASVFFNADGTYMSEGEKGTWALSGKTLTVTTASTIDEAAPITQGPDESTGDSGEKSVLTLLSVTDDAARVILSNGSNASWTRCSS